MINIKLKTRSFRNLNFRTDSLNSKEVTSLQSQNKKWTTNWQAFFDLNGQFSIHCSLIHCSPSILLGHTGIHIRMSIQLSESQKNNTGQFSDTSKFDNCLSLSASCPALFPLTTSYLVLYDWLILQLSENAGPKSLIYIGGQNIDILDWDIKCDTLDSCLNNCSPNHTFSWKLNQTSMD